MARIKIHNLFWTYGQTLLNIQMGVSKLIYLPAILSTFREEKISIPLIIQSSLQRQLITLSLILDQKDLAVGRVALQEGLDLTPPEFLKVKRNVILITFYGPHLGEIQGVASQLNKSLSQEGVEILAMSASLNSCLLVIPKPFLSKAKKALDKIFEIPQS